MKRQWVIPFIGLVLLSNLMACSNDKDKDGDKTKKLTPLTADEKTKAMDLFHDIGRIEVSQDSDTSELSVSSSSGLKLQKMKDFILSGRCDVKSTKSPLFSPNASLAPRKRTLKIQGTACPVSASYDWTAQDTGGVNSRQVTVTGNGNFKIPKDSDLATINEIIEMQMRGQARVVMRKGPGGRFVQMQGDFSATVVNISGEQGTFQVRLDGATEWRGDDVQGDTTETYTLEMGEFAAELKVTTTFKDDGFAQSYSLNGESIDETMAREFLEPLGGMHLKWRQAISADN